MQKAILALCLVVAATGCLAPRDLEAVKFAQLDFQKATLADLRRLENGVITRAEYDRRALELQNAHDEEIERVVVEVEERTEAVLAAATNLTGPITGQPLVDLLLGLGVTGAGTYMAVNRARDKKYVAAAPSHADPTKS